MKKKKIRKFTVVFEKAKEGGYVVSVPILPGCLSQGETFEEAERMIKDAIKCYCESLIKHDEPIPKEVSEKLLKCRSETSDYTDYLRLHRSLRRHINLCNLVFNQCNQRFLTFSEIS